MSDLDGKLKEILSHADVSNNRSVVWSEAELIAEIHQAFADAGYGITYIDGKPITELMFNDGTHLMTGQEWYDRFMDGLLLIKDESVRNHVISNARRAAGLEEA